MIRSLALGTIALTFLVCPRAQADDKADADFATLYADAWKTPDKADMTKLRQAFTETSKYQPYSLDRDEKAGVEKALSKGDVPGAIAAMNVVLEKKPLNFEHHAFAAFLHMKAGDKDLEAKHKAMTVAIMKSMLEGHDGKTFATSIPVIDVGEEYMILRSMKAKTKGQSLRTHEGHFFDVHAIADPETGKDREVFFNIDTPHNALSKMLKQKK